MAIVFEQPKKAVNWVRVLFFIFVIGFIVFAVYYLFFAPSPRLDIVLPAPLERASQISNIEFADPGRVLNHATFKKLQSYVGPPSVGSLGRDNPFIRF